MSRLIGETVIITTGAEREEITGAVFIPESGTMVTTVDRVAFTTGASVLLPMVKEISPVATIEARGLQFRQVGHAVHHISMFGTGRGGTQIFIERATG